MAAKRKKPSVKQRLRARARKDRNKETLPHHTEEGIKIAQEAFVANAKKPGAFQTRKGGPVLNRNNPEQKALAQRKADAKRRRARRKK